MKLILIHEQIKKMETSSFVYFSYIDVLFLQ
jgi:hypothetical protein